MILSYIGFGFNPQCEDCGKCDYHEDYQRIGECFGCDETLGTSGDCVVCQAFNQSVRYCQDCFNLDNYLSGAPCDNCDTSQMGTRFAVHGKDENGQLVHLEVCADCVGEFGS